ncbi:hypothetical protein ACOME3_007823 [Neoechinorhynchus agilis]
MYVSASEFIAIRHRILHMKATYRCINMFAGDRSYDAFQIEPKLEALAFRLLHRSTDVHCDPNAFHKSPNSVNICLIALLGNPYMFQSIPVSYICNFIHCNSLIQSDFASIKAKKKRGLQVGIWFDFFQNGKIYELRILIVFASHKYLTKDTGGFYDDKLNHSQTF